MTTIWNILCNTQMHFHFYTTRISQFNFLPCFCLKYSLKKQVVFFCYHELAFCNSLKWLSWLSFLVGNVPYWRSQDPESTKQYTKTYKKAQELMIQVNLLIFGQCKYSLANGKSSLETKQKRNTQRISLADFFSSWSYPTLCDTGFDFQQEAVGRSVLNPGLLRQAPACSRDLPGAPLSCWAARERRLLSTGQERDPPSGYFSFLEEFYSSCLGICLVRLRRGWKATKNGPEKSSVTEQTT